MCNCNRDNRFAFFLIFKQFSFLISRIYLFDGESLVYRDKLLNSGTEIFLIKELEYVQHKSEMNTFILLHSASHNSVLLVG